MKLKSVFLFLGCFFWGLLLIAATGHTAQHQTLLEFESTGQSMWQQGDAWQLNWRQDIPIYSWDYSFESEKSLAIPSLFPLIPPLPQFSIYGSSDGNIGLSPYVNIDSGSVSANYDLNVSIDLPDNHTVKPGESFTISTSYASLGTGVFTTNFPEVKAGVDILFDTHTSAGIRQYDGYGGLGNSTWAAAPSATHEFINLTVHPDEPIAINALGIPVGPFEPDLIYDENGRIPGLQFHNGTISLMGLAETDLLDEWSLGGYASVSMNVPDINTTGEEASGFTSEGEDDLFNFSVDMDKIALDIADKLIQAAITAGTAGAGSGTMAMDFPDLEGASNLEPIIGETLASLIPLEFSYNILDLESFFDIDVRQEFALTPNDLMVSFDFGDGTLTDPIPVGQDLTLTMKEDAFNIAPVFSLPDSTFDNLTELLIDLGLDVTLLDFGLDFSGLLELIPDIDPDPVFTEDLTLNEILAFMSIPTDWMNPDIFKRQFPFDFSPITSGILEILPAQGRPLASTPEPGTIILVGLGLLTIAGLSRQQSGQKTLF